MKVWEYETVIWEPEPSSWNTTWGKQFKKYLNKMGLQGWELVSTPEYKYSVTLIFKREVPEDEWHTRQG